MSRLLKWGLVLFFFMFQLCYVTGQEGSASDFLQGDIMLKVDPFNETVQGQVQYHFSINNTVDSVYLDARAMNISKVRLNGKKVRYSYDGRYLVLFRKYRENKEYSIDIHYSCKPDQAMYFLGWNDTIPGNEQVWTQGQGKYNSHWVPSFDEMSEKVSFSISIDFPKDYEVISNGKLIKTTNHDQTRSWYYEMIKPMSSYLLAFAGGRYSSERKISTSGIPLYLYYYPHDSLKTEPTYRYTKEIFDLLEKEIGVPYPWQNYKQVPVRDFLYAGMENTGVTLFSDSFMTDSTAFKDRNYVDVNAHELAHQWFGNLVTEQDASSHWLHEGFATYYSWLAQKEFLGEDHFYWMLLDKADDLETADREGKGTSLLDPAADSLTFYEKGAFAILILREYLGDQNFSQGVEEFLKAFAFKNATVDDFLAQLEATSATTLESFRQRWLESKTFHEKEVIQYLRKSYPPIDQFFKARLELISSTEDNEAIIKRFWESTTSSEFRKRLLLQHHRSLSTEFLKKAFNSTDFKVRQALSFLPGPVPEELIEDYESLLNDKSYITLENALFKLWILRPGQRNTYLDKCSGITGFSNKNIRQLWLLLAILTRDYLPVEELEEYRKELFSYTAEPYPMEVRQLAFQLIGEVFPYEDRNLKDLVNAAVHPAWQFRQFARTILKDLLSDEVQEERLRSILKELKGEEYEYLSNELNRE
ncbi:M1 family metallopeptidase [Muriicola sp. SD30]|uniref:M1 family metallopeptidase n=1 Tax=Muriicola sp. SD30 TaxID=3240936 RepID=UPI00350F6E7A